MNFDIKHPEIHETLWGPDAGNSGRTIDVWVAAVPVTWNIAPNGKDALPRWVRASAPSSSGGLGRTSA